MEPSVADAPDSSVPGLSASGNGEESVHFSFMEKALQKTTSKCVSAFRFSLLKRQFEPIYRKDPKAIQQLHEGAVSQLTLNIEEELKKMFEEENIVDFMAKLDELKKASDAADQDIVAWRPSGNPTEDAHPHLQPTYAKHLEQLQKIFDQLQFQNTLLQRNLQKHQSKLTQSQKALQDHLNVWKRANTLSTDDCQEVENFIKSL